MKPLPRRPKQRAKREVRQSYVGYAKFCAWWDASGKCKLPPKWLVALGDGLCDKHERVFHAKWNERLVPKTRASTKWAATVED